ncbi:MAG TPA: hypothetical protein VFM18_16300 [Methanosarcina sp.]|nr:hypothetical protein [Methanosarcina sp.]
MSQNVWLKSGKVYNLTPETNYTSGVTTTGAQPAVFKDSPYSAFSATVKGTGTVSATINIEVSNNGTDWVATPMGTITLSGTNSATDGFTSVAPWKYVRANVTAISGTGATVVVRMGV